MLWLNVQNVFLHVTCKTGKKGQSLDGLGVAFQVLMPEDSGSNPKAGTILGWFKNPVSSPTKKLMAATKSDYLGPHHL